MLVDSPVYPWKSVEFYFVYFYVFIVLKDGKNISSLWVLGGFLYHLEGLVVFNIAAQPL